MQGGPNLRLAATLVLTLAFALAGAPAAGGSKRRLPQKPSPDLRPLQPTNQSLTALVPPMKIRAESYAEDGPALRQISRTASGHSALTPDGEQLIYLSAGGLFVVSTRGGEPRKLAGGGTYFRFTPDARWVIVPGRAWTRLPLDGPEVPMDLAKTEAVHRLSGGVFSNTHVAFITAQGPMAVASILEGTSVRLPVDLPGDRRCHTGSGSPRAFSPDGKWLLFQHGCYGNELIRLDGTERRALDLIAAMFVDDLIVGSVESSPGKMDLNRLQVVSLSHPEKRWTIEGTALGQARRVPGRRALLTLDAQRRLVLVELEEKTVRPMHDGGGQVTGFLEVTPDGKRGLYATHHRDQACAVHQVDLVSGQRQRLAWVEGGRQCFIEPLGPRRAVLYAWRVHPVAGREAVVATIDLNTAAVQRLQVPKDSIGNLHTAGESVTLNTKGRLYVGRP